LYNNTNKYKEVTYIIWIIFNCLFKKLPTKCQDSFRLGYFKLYRKKRDAFLPAQESEARKELRNKKITKYFPINLHKLHWQASRRRRRVLGWGTNAAKRCPMQVEFFPIFPQRSRTSCSSSTHLPLPRILRLCQRAAMHSCGRFR